MQGQNTNWVKIYLTGLGQARFVQRSPCIISRSTKIMHFLLQGHSPRNGQTRLLSTRIDSGVWGRLWSWHPKDPLGRIEKSRGVSPIPGFSLALVSLNSAKIWGRKTLSNNTRLDNFFTFEFNLDQQCNKPPRPT